MSSNISNSSVTISNVTVLDLLNDLLLTVGIISSMLLIFLLIYLKVYHLNMRLLFLNIPTIYLLMLLSYVPIRLHRWFGIMNDMDNICAHFISLGIILMVYSTFALFIELVVSMHFPKHRASGSPAFSIFLLVTEWSIGILLTFFLQDNSVIKVSIIAWVVIALNLLALVIFPVIEKHSIKIYMKHANTSGTYILDHRFCHAESYRDARTLKRVMIVLCITSITIAMSYAILPFIRNSTLLVILAIITVLDILLQPIIIPIYIIIIEERIYRRIKMFVFRNKVQNINKKLTTITGNPLIINVNQHQELYFNSYRNAWGK